MQETRDRGPPLGGTTTLYVELGTSINCPPYSVGILAVPRSYKAVREVRFLYGVLCRMLEGITLRVRIPSSPLTLMAKLPNWKGIFSSSLACTISNPGGGMMSLEKIAEIQKPCLHVEHYPPMHLYLEPGVYKHTCPGCGYSFIFTVPLVTWSVDMTSIARRGTGITGSL